MGWRDRLIASTAFTLRALERRLSFIALAVVAAAGWWFLLVSESAMTSMQGEGFIMDLMWVMMSPASPLPYIAAASVMWIVMMVAMMVPAVVPLAMMYRGMLRGYNTEGCTFVFALGYLASWSVFSIAAAIVQWWLHANGWLHGMLLETSRPAAAGIFAVAGMWQLTPMKDACLSHCQSPMSFLMEHWREGYSGALALGFRHGLFCIGCCWVLMLLMFAGGAMSVVVMAALAGFILMERVIPGRLWSTQVPAVAMLAVACYLAFF